MSSITAPEPRPNRPIVLASSSPRRRQLLAGLGLRFTVRISDLDETLTAPDEPRTYVSSLARQKAERVAWETFPETETPDPNLAPLVIGADTAVVLDGEILGKPGDADAATAMLKRLRGRSHDVMTAVALVDTATKRGDVRVVTTTVSMRDFTDDDLAAYVATGEPLDKAGGYGIQKGTRKLIAGFDGCFTNVVGLPLCATAGWLADHGVFIPVERPWCRQPNGDACPRERIGTPT